MSYQTEQRKILLDFFSKNKDKIFSAEEISNKLKDSNISVSAVYRNLNSLEKSGKVRKSAKSGDTRAYYQYVDCDSCKGHLHMSCKKCGKTLHLNNADETLLINRVLQNSNFEINTNDTVLYGVCKNCKK